MAHATLDDSRTTSGAGLAKLDGFRGASRFTTWAYKFVLLEAGVRARRRAWHGREVALDDGHAHSAAGLGPSVQELVEGGEFLLELAGADADARLPGMRAHLEGCPACDEDHESLRDLAARG